MQYVVRHECLCKLKFGIARCTGCTTRRETGGKRVEADRLHQWYCHTNLSQVFNEEVLLLLLPSCPSLVVVVVADLFFLFFYFFVNVVVVVL